jgi:energy-coupling factor transport system ATP-binding protein
VPFALSGGEMRRVALAGILAMRPDVLILDEPTAGLDPRGRWELLERVGSWQAETGMTLILISHHLEEVARLAERVVLLARGRVAADGAVGQVLGDSRLLHSAGLSAPQPLALLEALRAAGWPVRTDRLLPEQVAAEIGQAWRQRSRS